MSRSGYTDDYDEEFPNALALYRRNVERAIDGKRGQAFLHELIAALDAMPEKKLIAHDLESHGAVCAIGSVGMRRGVDMTELNPEDAWTVGKTFGIAECMAREIVYENDGDNNWKRDAETPEERWQRMRDWAMRNLRSTANVP